ncbi:MAG TPA: TIGR03619 family F420-dependent LLM class oxidoreductase [Acidimicrobiales bacterium]|jgi:probable F420-dependent oxidoreductase|nr:TIGR03619 family F420-dependent LLM class oxidoreductase [Acidimicrobiales bacterium]
MDFWASVAFLDTDVQLEAARTADACELAGMMVPDHLFFARDYKTRYPYTADGEPLWRPDTHYPDPFAVTSAMAVLTTNVRFMTNVYVAPARDLFTVAKGLSTAAVISGGRMTLGVAAGWCEDEFVQTGQDFHTRGRRLDELLEVLPRLLAGGWVEHHGEFFDFDELRMEPVPSRPVPLYIGGDSDRALERAAQVGDGWLPPSAKRPEELEPLLHDMARRRKAAGTDSKPFEIVAAVHAMPDAELYKRLGDLGVTGVQCAPWLSRAPAKDGYGYDAEHVRTSIERFAEQIIAKVNR